MVVLRIIDLCPCLDFDIPSKVGHIDQTYVLLYIITCWSYQCCSHSFACSVFCRWLVLDTLHESLSSPSYPPALLSVRFAVPWPDSPATWRDCTTACMRSRNVDDRSNRALLSRSSRR